MNELINLTERCKKNDAKSQKRLYDRFSRQMFTICLRYCKDYDEATDVLQEGFIKVFQNIGQFRSDGNIGAWIRTIIVRTAINAIQRKIEFVSIDEQVINTHSYDMEIDFDRFNYQRLVQHIHTMPIGYQTVFNLYVFEEMTHSEIACELNISESTSRSQLYKARKMVQKLIMDDSELQPVLKSISYGNE